MTDNSLEWIKVPAGEFTLGLSDELRFQIRERLWLELGPAGDDQRLAALLRRLVDGLDSYSFDQLFHQLGLGNADLELLATERYTKLLSCIGMLRWQAKPTIVNTEAFEISRFPVTTRQFDNFLSGLGTSAAILPKFGTRPNGDSDANQLDMPIVTDWHLADLFCQSIGVRLPTEVEWEKAARGTDARLYPWGSNWDPTYCHCLSIPGQLSESRVTALPGRTASVNSYPRGVSPYGAWDMAGNVYEWTSTIVHFEDGHEGPVRKSHSPAHEQVAWFENIIALRWSGGYELADHYEYTGFRPVRDAWARKFWPGWNKSS